MNSQKILITLVLVLALGLSVFQLRFWWWGPRMEIESKHTSTTDGYVEIVFKVFNSKEVLVNGRSVTPSTEGLVRYTSRVVEGTSVWRVTLQDRFGSEKEELIYITYPQKLI